MWKNCPQASPGGNAHCNDLVLTVHMSKPDKNKLTGVSGHICLLTPVNLLLLFAFWVHRPFKALRKSAWVQIRWFGWSLTPSTAPCPDWESKLRRWRQTCTADSHVRAQQQQPVKSFLIPFLWLRSTRPKGRATKMVPFSSYSNWHCSKIACTSLPTKNSPPNYWRGELVAVVLLCKVKGHEWKWTGTAEV